MRLTRLLLFYIHREYIPGNIRTGKNKLIPPVTVHQKRKALLQAFQEEDNLKLLQNPYLTEEEDKYSPTFEETENTLNPPAPLEMKMLPHRYKADQLEHLNVQKKWE